MIIASGTHWINNSQYKQILRHAGPSNPDGQSQAFLSELQLPPFRHTGHSSEEKIMRDRLTIVAVQRPVPDSAALH